MPRLDVSGVPAQGGYIAKQCPVVIQNRILVPAEETPPGAEVQLRMQDGIAFEARVVERIRAESDLEYTEIPVVPTVTREEAIALTLEAMWEGVDLIEQGFLPIDEGGRRTGKPDLLVRHGNGYTAVDVKHHRTLDEGEGTTSVSGAHQPSPEHAYELDGFVLRKHSGDAFQLAHYHRLLEAAGFGSADAIGGILGKEGFVVWYDLNEPMWTTAAKSDGKKRKQRSSLERYDFEFDFRLDIAATAIAHRVDPAVSLIVEAMACGECDECGFHDYCFTGLEAGSGDVSLLPQTTYPNWRALRDAGLRQRDQVAALHYPTASLMSDGVEIPFFRDLAKEMDAATPLSELRPRARKQLSVLKESGITSVGDLQSSTDEATAAIGGFVAARILDARAAIGPEPVYRRPAQAPTDVPRADIEIDIDMENINEGVYLWGTLLTDRPGSGIFEPEYRPFYSWDYLSDEVELTVFSEMWAWLTEVTGQATELGMTLRCYVWHEPAENTQLRRIARKADRHIEAHVEEFIASDHWVDLKKVFADGWLTGGGVGLKSIAPLAGFAWPVEDPGGGLSMVKYSEAVGEDRGVAEAAREWLLDYNKGDVMATLAIREWLDAEGSTWPEVPAN